MNELAVIMRSLGMNPTKTELTNYMKEKNGKLAFADFLDVMHTHSTKENLPKELLEAFRCGDPQRKGMIPARDLRRILIKWGEKLSTKEGKFHYRVSKNKNIFETSELHYKVNLFYPLTIFQLTKYFVKPTLVPMEW